MIQSFDKKNLFKWNVVPTSAIGGWVSAGGFHDKDPLGVWVSVLITELHTLY